MHDSTVPIILFVSFFGRCVGGCVVCALPIPGEGRGTVVWVVSMQRDGWVRPVRVLSSAVRMHVEIIDPFSALHLLFILYPFGSIMIVLHI